MSLIKNVQVDQLLGYYAAGTTARKGSLVDMAGYEGCMFIFEFGTLLETGTIVCSLSGNSTDATGGTALAATNSHTVTATTAALTQSAMVIEIVQPEGGTYRYIEPIITLGVANTVILGITAIRYNGKVKPELTTGLLSAATLAVSPAAA